MVNTDDDITQQALCCPRCGGALVAGDPWCCGDCGSRFPLLAGIPCLVNEPEVMLGAWRTRLAALLAELDAQAERFRSAVSDQVARPSTRNRLKLLASASSDHARRLRALLAPLELAGGSAAIETYRALGSSGLPAGQGLTSYYANLHRDWCWGEVENEAGLDAVSRALGSTVLGRTLVLGCGAGRLAYELHRRYRPECLFAADINPLMLLVAQRVSAGHAVELYEFPVAPRDLGSHAILRRLEAPEAAGPGLHWLLADASRGAFAPGAFDVIVTHWLVDILAEDFAVVARRINAWLKPGGLWINSGSLVFQQPDPAQCYSLEEVREICTEAGFAPLDLREDRQPYLQSPASRHARTETVVSWSARKEAEVAIPAARAAVPPWIERPDVPVPLRPEITRSVLSMRVYAYVASLVDGQRSLDDIARVLVQERLMTAAEAAPAVRGFLLRLHEESMAQSSP
jgi:SAM-dependent methyltransferase/ribosomal protein S27AE